MIVNVNIKSWIIISAIVVIIFFLTVSQRLGSTQIETAHRWKNMDLQDKLLPKMNIENVNIEEHYRKIEGINTFYTNAEPPTGVEKSNKVLVLLHGQAFTSQTWINQVPTVTTMASLGHRVIAVDLPGYGNTEKKADNKGEFLFAFLNAVLGDDVKPVVVTPSMSGSFIIPLLQDHPDRLLGWVPVAPVNTGAPGDKFYKDLTVPTMIVYGEKDTGLGHTSRDNLVKMPNSTKPQVLPGAGHPAYLDQPDLWHKLLYNFMLSL